MRVLRPGGSSPSGRCRSAGCSSCCGRCCRCWTSIPGPQAEALAVGARRAHRPRHPSRFAVGAATLSLLTPRGRGRRRWRSLVDDAHLLDESSAQALAFAARRMVSDRIAVVVALRRDHDSAFAGLPTLHLGPLDRGEAPEPCSRARDRSAGRRLGSPASTRPPGATPWPSSTWPVRPNGSRGPARHTRWRSPEPCSRHTPARRSRCRLRRARHCSSRPPTTTTSRPWAAPARRPGSAWRPSRRPRRAGLVRLTDSAVEFHHPLVRAAVYGEASARCATGGAPPAGGSGGARRGWTAARGTWPRPRSARTTPRPHCSTTPPRTPGGGGPTPWPRRSWSGPPRSRPTPGCAARDSCGPGEQAWLAGASEDAARLLRQSLALAASPLDRALALGGWDPSSPGVGRWSRRGTCCSPRRRMRHPTTRMRQRPARRCRRGLRLPVRLRLGPARGRAAGRPDREVGLTVGTPDRADGGRVRPRPRWAGRPRRRPHPGGDGRTAGRRCRERPVAVPVGAGGPDVPARGRGGQGRHGRRGADRPDRRGGGHAALPADPDRP